MANRILEELVKRGTLDRIAKDLGLKCIPFITYEVVDTNCVMAARSTTHVSGLFFRIITGQSTEGEICVNEKALESVQRRYAMMCGNKRAAVDVTISLLRHECRHLYQAEKGMRIGHEYNDLAEFSVSMMDGHGADPMEMDANNYAISAARNPRMREMAIYMEVEQRSMGIGNQYNKEFRKELRDAAVNMIDNYNRAMGLAFRVLTM